MHQAKGHALGTVGNVDNNTTASADFFLSVRVFVFIFPTNVLSIYMRGSDMLVMSMSCMLPQHVGERQWPGLSPGARGDKELRPRRRGTQWSICDRLMLWNLGTGVANFWLTIMPGFGNGDLLAILPKHLH